MSDDDIDDKIPQSGNSTPVVSDNQPKSIPTEKPNIYISKSAKFRQSSQSDDDNIEIEGQLGDIDKEFERATQELILKTSETGQQEPVKYTKKSKQNDDSDKSDSDSSIFSNSGIWDGVHDDKDDNKIDVDELLGSMKNNRSRNEMDGFGFDNSQLEDLSNKMDEISTSVDNLEESFGELTKKVDRMSKNIKKILDMMNILAGNPEPTKSKKHDVIDASDVNDPVNNASYFDMVSYDTPNIQ